MPDTMIPQFRFADGELVVDSRFGEMRLRWLPEPHAVERGHASKRLKPFWPEFCIVRDEEGSEDRGRNSDGGCVEEEPQNTQNTQKKVIHREDAKDAKGGGRVEAGSPVSEVGGQRAEGELGREVAFQALRAQIPDDVAACGARFSSHQWPVMLMVHNQPLAARSGDAYSMRGGNRGIPALLGFAR